MGTIERFFNVLRATHPGGQVALLFFDIRQSIHHLTFARDEIFTYLCSPGQRAKIHEIIAFCC